MLFHKNILETIGDTPLVRLNKVITTSAMVLAKIESFNPGNSTKVCHARYSGLDKKMENQ